MNKFVNIISWRRNSGYASISFGIGVFWQHQRNFHLNVSRKNQFYSRLQNSYSLNFFTRRSLYFKKDGYERFEKINGAANVGRKSTYIILSICGLGLMVHYFSHLEKVPISGRSRYINTSESMETTLGNAAFDQMISQVQDHVLPSYHPLTIYVKRVTDNLMKSVSKLPGLNPIHYSVYVVDSPLVNAMVLPGGQIFVFTGIIPIAGNEDGLATVLAHEVNDCSLVYHLILILLF